MHNKEADVENTKMKKPSEICVTIHCLSVISLWGEMCVN